jgi:hypothetical protein
MVIARTRCSVFWKIERIDWQQLWTKFKRENSDRREKIIARSQQVPDTVSQMLSSLGWTICCHDSPVRHKVLYLCRPHFSLASGTKGGIISFRRRQDFAASAAIISSMRRSRFRTSTSSDCPALGGVGVPGAMVFMNIS